MEGDAAHPRGLREKGKSHIMQGGTGYVCTYVHCCSVTLGAHYKWLLAQHCGLSDSITHSVVRDTCTYVYTNDCGVWDGIISDYVQHTFTIGPGRLATLTDS